MISIEFRGFVALRKQAVLMTNKNNKTKLRSMAAAIFNRRLPARMMAMAFSAAAGALIADTALNTTTTYREIIYTVDMKSNDFIFNTVADKRLMEHPLWMPFSQGRMLDAAYFAENPLASYAITTRNDRFTDWMGVRLVTDIARMDHRPSLDSKAPAPR